MAERVNVQVKMDRDVWESFQSFVIETHGQKYGNLGREAENALVEYMDHDRAARIEEKVDRVLARFDELDATHTHKASESAAKVRKIADKLAREERTVIPKDTVRRAIEDVAGADDRTVRKYRDLLKRRELAYKHPTDGVWTQDRDEWVRWVVEYVNNNPTVTRMDVIDDYPIGYDELDRLATEVVEA